jgi:hypothetical protein
MSKRKRERERAANAAYSESHFDVRDYWRTGCWTDCLSQSAVSAAAPAALLWISSAAPTLWILPAAAAHVLSAAPTLRLLPAVPTMAHVERLPTALHGSGRPL